MRFASLLALVLFAAPSVAAAQALCLVGAHPGMSEVDAETAASLVCEELRRRGVPVSTPAFEARDGDEVYRVNLRPLGRKVFLSVQHERPLGTIVAERQLPLNEIEEATAAAPRLAEALAEDKPIEQTAAIDSLVGEETRRYRKKGGEGFWGLGVLGMAVPDTDAFPGVGFALRGQFEAEDFGVVAEWRFGAGGPEQDTVGFTALTIGGRYFFSDSNWTPYLGGGLGWAGIGVEKDGFEGFQNGLGGYVETGVEALRFYKSRLDLTVRAELPFFEVEEQGWDYVEGDRERQRYYAPITFGLTYLWR